MTKCRCGVVHRATHWNCPACFRRTNEERSHPMSCRCGRDTDVHLCHAGGYTCHHAGRRYDSTLHGRPYTTWVCAAHLASYQQIERLRNGAGR